MIRYVREHLSIAERAHGDGKWVVHLPGILGHYNNSMIRGTTFRRKSVTQFNYISMLSQLRRTPDVSMLFNMQQPFNYGTALSKYIWRYRPGDRVIIARRINYEIRNRSYFEKASRTGAFGEKVYSVLSCTAKVNSALFITPAYRLSGLTSTLFYDSELSPALFDDKSPPASTTTPSPRNLPLTRKFRRGTSNL